MNNALITSIIAGTYKIKDIETKEVYISKPRGVLRIKGVTPKVGDYITYSINPDSTAIIETIKPRHNDLIRPFVSNVDQVFIIFSVKEPDLNLNLLDKFIVSLEYNNITPIIIFSKWDLLNDKEKKELNKIKAYYEQIGYTVIPTSNIESISNKLIDLLKGKISAFTGQSGVGKSSLLNAIDPTFNLKTTEISQALNRGKHTTRSVELYDICGGMVADTPGFGDLEFFDMDDKSLSQNFTEFFKLSKDCKYNGCLHLNEPGCAVKAALQNNQILPSRYENYLAFINEIKTTKKTY